MGEEAAREYLERKVTSSIGKPQSVQKRCRAFAVVRGEGLGKGDIQQLKRRGHINPTKISSREARTGGHEAHQVQRGRTRNSCKGIRVPAGQHQWVVRYR